MLYAKLRRKSITRSSGITRKLASWFFVCLLAFSLVGPETATLAFASPAAVPGQDVPTAKDGSQIPDPGAAHAGSDPSEIVAVPKPGISPVEVERNVKAIDEHVGMLNTVELVENPTEAQKETAVVVEATQGAQEAVLDELAESGLYESVDYKHQYSIMALPYSSAPNDTYFTDPGSWALKGGAGSNFAAVWPKLANAASATSVSVAVLDTGFRMNHPDKGTNITVGYDFGDSDTTIDPPPVASVGARNTNHGTFVAGLISAETNNGTGISGAAWDTKVIMYKVMDKTGGIDTVYLVNAINEAIDRDVDVINISLGGTVNDANIAAAVKRAYDNGIVVVAASGNYGSPTGGGAIVYPAANPGVISVAATTQNRTRASFSTYNAGVDISAPGVGIRGLIATGGDYSTATGQGTSYSAPYVAAGAALLKRMNPNLTNKQIEDIMYRTAQDVVDAGPGKDQQTGWGILDMKKASAEVETTLVSATHVSVSPATVTLRKGYTAKLTASLQPPNSTDSVIWSSSNNSVATVSNGTVIAKAAGSATIQARIPSGATAKSTVVVLPPADVVRIAGPGRYETAAAASKDAYPSGAKVAIVASGQEFPDALSASGLSGAVDAPILLTTATSMPPSTAQELARLKPTKVYVVGGTGAVSQAVENSIKRYAPTVRLAGIDRFKTSLAIAKEVVRNDGSRTEFFLANASSFPDALSASSLAQQKRIPILLTGATTTDPSVLSFVSTYAPKSAVIVGGTGVVSTATQNALAARNVSVVRWGGLQRYETSAIIAQRGASRWGINTELYGVASGEDYPDALAGGAALGSKNGVLILTQPKSLPAQTANVITSRALTIDTVNVYGGTGVVSDSVTGQIKAILK